MTTEADALTFRENKWSAIPRIARTIPFGYELDEENSDQLLPIQSELDALELAKKHLKQYSYRDVAQWLTETTGRYISHMGLKKRVNNERARRHKGQTYAKWAKRYEEARAKAEKFEKQRLGAREDI